MSRSNGNEIVRTARKIKYFRKKKLTRNNVRAKLKKQALEEL